jgi:sulfhydrogenase subunit alpha
VLSLAGVAPETVTLGLRLKKLGNTIQEVVGGRAVHPVNYVLGGFGRLPSTDDLVRLRDALEAALADCDTAVRFAEGLPIPACGDAPVRCAAVVPDGDTLFFGTRFRVSDGPELPVEDYRSLTNEHAVAHSHAKHSLCAGRPYMVGALARVTLHGDRLGPLARAARDRLGLSRPTANVVMNNLAQVVEIAYSVEHALALVRRLLDEGLVAESPPVPRVRAAEAVAASEAPRGTLFHRYRLDADGRVVAADVITPTAQNFSHAELSFREGVGRLAAAGDEELRRLLEIVARAYDPCVSCSVHAIRAR